MIRILLGILLLTASHAQGSNPIIGNWLTDDGERKIEIYAQGDKFAGKIVWVKSIERRNEIGKIVMTDLKFEKGTYDGGQFFMPTQKHSTSCAADLEGNDNLKINIYHGIKFLGTTMRLKRVT